jgi:tRNA-Thr(GGU) m(6)t(6)A37 methyltransferase TsaA
VKATDEQQRSEETMENEMISSVELKPIGYVRSPREEKEDDYWGAVVSVIELDPEQFSEEVLYGLSDFSHLEVIFFMHGVSTDKIETKARHPRNNPEWPKVGIFAQRPKARPNRLGLSRVNILKVEGLCITVQALDAIEGTPILDIKPYMAEFGVRGEVRQPEWSHQLMSDYYKD